MLGYGYIGGYGNIIMNPTDSSKQLELVKKFQAIGSEKIEITDVSATETTMVQVFQAYPTKWFTQTDFVKTLQKSNPRVNKILRALVEKGTIEVQTGRQYHYRYVKPKA